MNNPKKVFYWALLFTILSFLSAAIPVVRDHNSLIREDSIFVILIAIISFLSPIIAFLLNLKTIKLSKNNPTNSGVYSALAGMFILINIVSLVIIFPMFTLFR